jgi:hypothetical protein
MSLKGEILCSEKNSGLNHRNFLKKGDLPMGTGTAPEL